MARQKDSYDISINLLVVIALCFVLQIPVVASAQVAGGTFTGSVTDASGAIIPGARISIKNTATGVVTATRTNAAGIYTVANLLPSTYAITVSAPGFSTEVRTGITLTVGAVQVLNLRLRIGQVTEHIQVEGQAPLVQLATSTLSATVRSTTIRELPLNGRDWASLATLQPGVVSVRTHEQITQVGSQARGLGMQMSIDGNRPTQNGYRLNGVIINDYSNAGPGSVLGQNLGVDAIQEFSVLTSNYSAEYGFTSGGVINAITRSGSNQFHGSVYEFLRNDSLDAANFFDNANGLTKAPFRRNQFGASAGGPIKKDKIFIFGDYEGLRQSKGISTVSHTLSLNARNGLLNDPNGNPLPPVTVDHQIQKFLAFYPLPNSGLIGPDNNTGIYAFAGQQVVPENYLTTRGDVNISEKDSMNASWYYDHSTFTQPDALNQVLDEFIVMRQGASLEESHIISASMVNAVRLGFNRSTVAGDLTPAAINPAAADPSLGISPGFFAPGISAPGLTDFHGGLRGQSVQNYVGQTFQVYDDALHTVGTHNLKFGGMFIRYQDNVYATFTGDGDATFNSLADMLQNIPFKSDGPPSLAGISPHNNRTSIFAVYIQDDWHARAGLTLNLGLRYEMSTIPTEVQGKIANLPTIYTNPNTGPFNKVYFTSNPTTKNFEPRIGFAWDPFHNGKTSIRGGFGVFDVLPLPYELVINNAQTSPFAVTPTLVNPPQGSFPHELAGLFASPPSTNQTWNYVEPNPKRNYVYQWNFNVQRQITPNTSITLAYVGSRGLHNPFQIDDINTVFPTLTPAGYLFPNPVGSGTPLNPYVGGIQTTIWQSKAWYNSFQAEINKRLSHGFQVQASYTWSKTMDTSSGSFAGDNYAGDLSPTIPWWNLSIVKGLADFNVGRNLVLNGLWRIPTPTSFSGTAGWIARGWQVGGVLTLSDGVPVWPLWGVEGDPMGQLNFEPIGIEDRLTGGGCTSLISPGDVQYIKPQCLIVPIAPSQAFWAANCDPQPLLLLFNDPTKVSYPTCFNLMGNLGRNTVVGPGEANLDFSIVKDNPIKRFSESFDIQFRAEFFNILNRANFAPPVDNLEAIDSTGVQIPGFGTLDNTQTDPRDIQFALKIIW